MFWLCFAITLVFVLLLLFLEDALLQLMHQRRRAVLQVEQELMLKSFL